MAAARNTLVVAGLAALVAAGGVALAQGPGPDDLIHTIARHDQPGGHGWRHGMGPGGPGRMGARLCAAKEPIAPRIAARIESTVKPTDAQKADFDALKSAMGKAEETLKASCPTEAELADRTPPGRLALAEKRMSAGLDALRAVRAPFNTLYAKLDDKQRDALRWAAPRGFGPMGGGRL